MRSITHLHYERAPYCAVSSRSAYLTLLRLRQLFGGIQQVRLSRAGQETSRSGRRSERRSERHSRDRKIEALC